MDQPNRMLSYWVNEKGIDEALEDYYPELLRQDYILGPAFAEYKKAAWIIRKRVDEIARIAWAEDKD